MRALSVRQPWAELIASGKKKIEYRTWQRDFRGDLLIVSSASRHDDDCAEKGLDPEALGYGVAVCVADFWKVTGDDGDYCWHLRNPRRVEAFRVKGYASIYHVDDNLIRFSRGGAAYAATRSTSQTATTKRETTEPTRRARERTVPKLSGRPRVLVATPDARTVKRWTKALSDAGCHVSSFRDGYAAWQHLSTKGAACLVVDAEVQGYSALEIIRRMREDATYAETPIIVAGGAPTSTNSLVSRVKRAAGADEIARAVRGALIAEE